MEEGKNGGDVVFEPSADGGSFGAGEKTSFECSVSNSRIADSAAGSSHGGGIMLALRWRLRSRASHNGILLLCGGFNSGVGP